MTASHDAPRAGGVLPTATDGALRLRYLQEVGALLWPAPARAEVVAANPATGNRAIDGADPDGHKPGSHKPGSHKPGSRDPDGHAPGNRAMAEDAERLSEFILVPDAKRPRLLVPAADRRAAAAAVRRYAEPGSTRLRITLGLLSTALGTGLGGLLMRDRMVVSRRAAGAAEPNGARTDRADVDGRADTIEHYLRAALDSDLVLSLHIGPARANRKPVLQLLTRDGATTGFAKLGINDLTRALVLAERDSLLEVSGAGLRHTTVPSVLHHGSWNDLEVLVQSPLPVWRRRGVTTPARLATTLVEIAEIGEVSREAVRDSAYWTELGARLDALGQGEAAGSLRAAYVRIGERVGDTEALRFGAWHGDLTPWNMATLRDTICVWDWERFCHGVPMGFDAVHYAFQGAVVRQKQDPRTAIADCVRRAPEILAAFHPGEHAEPERRERAARLTVVLYLIDIAARYLHDGQAEAGARLGALGQWLLPVLVDEVEGF